MQCPAHGVKQVRVPWAEPRSRFTLLMERLIIDLILQCSTVKGACQIASVSWDEAWGIMSRAVARGQARKEARPITYIGVDAKAFRKGHRYHTIVCDLERATVEFVADDRKTESLAGYYAQLADAQKIALHAVAMDMWEPYIGATRKGLPDGHQDCVRPIPHHAGHDESRRHGAEAGAPHVSSRWWRLAADWHEVPVAVQRGAPARTP